MVLEEAVDEAVAAADFLQYEAFGGEVEEGDGDFGLRCDGLPRRFRDGLARHGGLRLQGGAGRGLHLREGCDGQHGRVV